MWVWCGLCSVGVVWTVQCGCGVDCAVWVWCGICSVMWRLVYTVDVVVIVL